MPWRWTRPGNLAPLLGWSSPVHACRKWRVRVTYKPVFQDAAIWRLRCALWVVGGGWMNAAGWSGVAGRTSRVVRTDRAVRFRFERCRFEQGGVIARILKVIFSPRTARNRRVPQFTSRGLPSHLDTWSLGRGTREQCQSPRSEFSLSEGGRQAECLRTRCRRCDSHRNGCASNSSLICPNLCLVSQAIESCRATPDASRPRGSAHTSDRSHEPSFRSCSLAKQFIHRKDAVGSGRRTLRFLKSRC